VSVSLPQATMEVGWVSFLPSATGPRLARQPLSGCALAFFRWVTLMVVQLVRRGMVHMPLFV